MPIEPTNTPAGAQAGQPAGGGATPAATTDLGEQEKDKDSERLAIRQRAIDAERKVARLVEQAKKAVEEKLAEQGKFQELAKAKEAEANDWKGRYIQSQRQNALIAAGAKAGIIDAGDLVLAKLGEVDIEDSAALAKEADDAVSKLAQSKPYLFNKGGKPGTPFETPAAVPGGPSKVKLNGPVHRDDVHKLSRDEKQLLVKQAFGEAASAFGGGFFRKG